MRRLNSLLFLLLVGGGVYVFLQNFKVEGLKGLRVQPRAEGEGIGGFFGSPSVTSTSSGPAKQTDSIRIATFNVQVFGATKIQKLVVLDKLASICQRFDVIAIQEIQSADQDILPKLVEHINTKFGAQYDYVIGPRLGRSHEKEQYGFVFNGATLEVNRAGLYSLNDPDDLLHREPFVASFRARWPKPEEAFTFTLVNIRTDPDDLARELNVLDDVLRLVRDDGLQEDDVILLGDFNIDDRQYGELGSVAGLAGAIRGVPTNTHGTHHLDNILFVQHATREFTGRSGVFDFMREFNLSVQEALEISDRMPVWAEFSVFEGGVPGQVATRPPVGN